MVKKLLSLTLAVVMIFSCSMLTFAQAADSKTNGEITRDTVITQDNMNDILKHYGIDPKIGKKSNSTNTIAITTVGQLEDALNALNQLPKGQTINISETLNNNTSTTPTTPTSTVSPMFKNIGTVNLSSDSWPTSDWGLRHTCTGEYFIDTDAGIQRWIGAYNAAVLLITPNPSLPGLKYQLDAVNSIGVTYTDNTITETSDVIVGTYLVIGVPPLSYDLYMGSNQVTTTYYWGTSYIHL